MLPTVVPVVDCGVFFRPELDGTGEFERTSIHLDTQLGWQVYEGFRLRGLYEKVHWWKSRKLTVSRTTDHLARHHHLLVDDFEIPIWTRLLPGVDAEKFDLLAQNLLYIFFLGCETSLMGAELYG